MERESNPMQALCRSGCGFYGSPATDGLCSLCYKEALKKKQQPPASSASAGGGGSPAGAGPAPGLTSSLIDTAQPTIPVIAPPLPAPTPAIDIGKDVSLIRSFRATCQPCADIICDNAELLQNLQVKMDSDTDQDEDELKPSFSISVSETGSHCHILGRVHSESTKLSGVLSNCSVNMDKNSIKVFGEGSTSGIMESTGSSNKEDPALRVIRVSCIPQKVVSLKSIDDRMFSPEKAINEVVDSVHNVKESGDSIAEENTQEVSEQSLVPEESIPNSNGSEESHIPGPSTTISNHTQDDPPDNVKENHTLNNSQNNLLHIDASANSELAQKTVSREVKAKKSDIAQSETYQAIQMIVESLVFQSTSLEPVESNLSTQSDGSSDLPDGMMHKDNQQDSSSTGQLSGRKRKHSGKKTADAEGAVGGSSAENSVSSGDAEESFENKDSDKEAKKKKNRCAVCRKKVGLTGFECRCGGLFCAVHRYSDKHDCTFDYREMGAQEIRRNNPVVVGEKIQKI